MTHSCSCGLACLTDAELDAHRAKTGHEKATGVLQSARDALNPSYALVFDDVHRELAKEVVRLTEENQKLIAADMEQLRAGITELRASLTPTAKEAQLTRALEEAHVEQATERRQAEADRDTLRARLAEMRSNNDVLQAHNALFAEKAKNAIEKLAEMTAARDEACRIGKYVATYLGGELNVSMEPTTKRLDELANVGKETP